MGFAPGQCSGDDVVQCGEARLPAGLAHDPRRAGNKAGGIAGAAWGEAVRHRAAADALHALDHLQHRMPGGGAEVVGDAGVVQPFQRREVGGGEVRHVDVVADAGAVRRVVVGAKHRQFGAAAEHGVDGQRDQVGFRRVVLAQAALGVGAGGVEVAQAGGAHAVDAFGPAQRALHHPFAFAIGGAGVDRGFLVDRHAVWRAEQGGSGGEHEAGHAVLHAGFQQAQAVADIGRKIADRVAHGIAHQRQRGEVEHRMPRPLGQHGRDRIGVFQRTGDQRGAGEHGFAMAGAQVVEHHHLRALVEQGGDEMAADKAGTSGNEKAA